MLRWVSRKDSEFFFVGLESWKHVSLRFSPLCKSGKKILRAFDIKINFLQLVPFLDIPFCKPGNKYLEFLIKKFNFLQLDPFLDI
jgi:hypothetical protein